MVMDCDGGILSNSCVEARRHASYFAPVRAAPAFPGYDDSSSGGMQSIIHPNFGQATFEMR